MRPCTLATLNSLQFEARVSNFLLMSFAQVLEELPALTSEQRREILDRIVELDRGGWLDVDDPLSEADKQIIESRLAEHEADTASAISFEELESRLRERNRK